MKYEGGNIGTWDFSVNGPGEIHVIERNNSWEMLEKNLILTASVIESEEESSTGQLHAYSQDQSLKIFNSTKNEF